MAHKHKKPNPKPIIQIPPVEYFSQDPEPMPDWLKKHKAGTPVSIRDIWDSRVVYYPGAGTEGSPIHVLNAAHAAHVFVYADFGFAKEDIDQALSDDAFRGYHLHHQQKVSKTELAPRAPVSHLTDAEKQFAAAQYAHVIIPDPKGFAMLKIYERDESVGEEHGAWRFAVLYLGADAIAAYDMLFGNTTCTPYACITDSYGFGNAYDTFTQGGLMEKIAIRADRLPRYLLSSNGGWDGYQQLTVVSGSRFRFVWSRKDVIKERGEMHLCRDLDKNLKSIISFVE